MPKLAVLGQPVSHSRSPAMHTAALEELGLGGEWSYEAIELAPEDFAPRVRGLPARGFAGVNVTVPHKLAALARGDQRVAGGALGIGAANTLTFADGRIAAENTDAPGIIAALPGPSGPAGARPGGRRLGPGGGLGAAGRGRRAWRSGTAPPERPRRWRPSSAPTAISRRDGGVAADGFDLVVNATTVGLEAAIRSREPGG